MEYESEYNIIKQKTRKSSIQFKVENGKINVYTPLKVDKTFVKNVYLKYRTRLLKQLEQSKENSSKIILFGKSFDIEKQYSKLIIKPVFTFQNKHFIIILPERHEIDFNEYLIEWKKELIKNIIIRKVKYFVEKYNFNFDFMANTIQIKDQRTKWGSCSYVNNLNFNYHIIEKENDVIDYLVLHELTHTIHKNHSTQFWNTLEKYCPNYLELRNKLKK